MIQSVEKIYIPEGYQFKMTMTNGKIWSVPLDEANSDYQAIMEFIADGGTVIDNGGGE